MAKGTPQGKAARRFVRGAMQPGARNNTEGVTESLLGMLFATPTSELGDTSTAEGTEDMAAQLQRAAEQLVIAMLNQYLGKQRNKVGFHMLTPAACIPNISPWFAVVHPFQSM